MVTQRAGRNKHHKLCRIRLGVLWSHQMRGSSLRSISMKETEAHSMVYNTFWQFAFRRYEPQLIKQRNREVEVDTSKDAKTGCGCSVALSILVCFLCTSYSVTLCLWKIPERGKSQLSWTCGNILGLTRNFWHPIVPPDTEELSFWWKVGWLIECAVKDVDEITCVCLWKWISTGHTSINCR